MEGTKIRTIFQGLQQIYFVVDKIESHGSLDTHIHKELKTISIYLHLMLAVSLSLCFCFSYLLPGVNRKQQLRSFFDDS